MQIVDKIDNLREILFHHRMDKKKIGFVPTMGFLHEGHLSLVRRAKNENDLVVVSIFINPIQFGANEDLDRYPRDIENDKKMLNSVSCDILFSPSVKEMYPENFSTKVSVSGITEKMCGISRPGHFDGVATVVLKLFNIVSPDNAYFGMKDYQQLLVIKKMTQDLNLCVKVHGCPIVRDKDGLGLSSRNVYLSDRERISALSLNRSFDIVQKMLDDGCRDSEEIVDSVKRFISSHDFVKIDYVVLADTENLDPVHKIENRFILAMAVFVGKTRLIDNKIFEV